MFSDRRYNQYFYGVDPAFATAARPAYNAGGGYGGAQFIMSLSKRYREFWIGGFAKWDTLAKRSLPTARWSRPGSPGRGESPLPG